MNDLAKFNYVGSSGAQDAGDDAYGTGGGSGGGTGGAGAFRGGGVFAAGGADANRVLVTLASMDRDKRQYPDANECTLALPEQFTGVTGVALTSAEIPHASYNTMNPVLYFSEKHDDTWHPFMAAMSPGNYEISDFVDGLTSSLASAAGVTSEISAVLNTYSVTYSEAWGRVAVSSDRVCEFSLQFRKEPVAVTGASISADGAHVTVSVSDSQGGPLSPGAGVMFIAGGGYSTVQCVVEDTDPSGNTVDLRVVPRILGTVNSRAVSEVGRDATGDVVTPRIQTLLGVYKTAVPGARLNVATSAQLVPLAGGAQNNLGDLLGFGTLQDRNSGSGLALAAMQGPFSRGDGTAVVTTTFPHFCQRGDVVRIEGTGTLLDNVHSVRAALDETHLQLIPDVTVFLQSMPQLLFYIDGPDAPPTCLDIVEDVELVSADGGAAELLITLKDKRSGGYPVENFTDMKMAFAVDNRFYGGPFRREWAYATATIGEIYAEGSSPYLNRMQMFFRYPTFVLSMTDATVSKVADYALPEFSQTGDYQPSCIVSPNRYDFSRSNRSVYVTLDINGRAMGNLLLRSLPGRRVFAKVPLTAGRDVVSFLNKMLLEGAATLKDALPTVREVSVGVYGSDGLLYDFAGAEYELTLEFQCKAPPGSS